MMDVYNRMKNCPDIVKMGNDYINLENEDNDTGDADDKISVNWKDANNLE